MNTSLNKIFMICVCAAFAGMAQTADAYEEQEGESKGLLDPSRFSVNHAASFGMSSSSNTSGLQSQSLYMTMMQYQFSKPVTLNLNFGLPIHSTYSSAHNLTPDNIKSADYLRSMPFSASLSWQPTDRLHMSLTVARDSYGPSLFYSDRFYEPSFHYGRLGDFERETK